MAPALTIGRVIKKLAPADYQLNRMVFQLPDLYSNFSAIVAETPKSTLQALMLLLAWKSYEPFLTFTAPLVRTLSDYLRDALTRHRLADCHSR